MIYRYILILVVELLYGEPLSIILELLDAHENAVSIPINILLSRTDPDHPLRLLEESRKQNYFIRTVKIIKVTLIKQSIGSS